MSLTTAITRPFRADPRTGRPSWVSRKIVRARIRRNRTAVGIRTWARRSGRAAVSEAADIAGLALIAVGVGMFLVPAGVIVGGIGCLLYGASNSRRGQQ
ncbi:hypothetical protein SMCF_1921 [Streptomyces coelicoflavus ZG0656]|nr:hypothetical protein SMCF_1921 [Streptomyces coelicoflavus ZG0656]MZE44945.1 hypothetical protein [Streptomyces sp. SID5477]